MFQLTGKVALVTGASRGIGRAIAVALARQGATVLAAARGDNAVDTVAAITAAGGRAELVSLDVTDSAALEALPASIVARHGRLDIVVSNAGITRDQLLMRMKREDWDAVIATNLKSVFNMTKAVMRVMLKQRNGSIINMSSVVGVKGNAGQANYAASKAGVIGFTKSVALELGSRNIRSNAIAPGFIETEMTGALDPKVVEQWREGIPLKRGGTPTDVANACVFLGSDLSAYITGQTLHVCGGMLT